MNKQKVNSKVKVDKETMKQANFSFMIALALLLILLSVTIIKIGNSGLFEYIKASIGKMFS
ncbi:MAG: hypothetical protein RSA10_02840 [Bacilli bacterium]